MHDIFVPALGHAMEDCVVVEWLKQPGDPVADGDEVVCIETDKSTVDVAADASGTLGRHRYSVGDRVPVGEVLAYVLGDGETEPADAADGGGTPAPASVESPPTDAAEQPAPPPVATPSAGDPHRMSPRQRRLAQEAARAADTDTGRAAAAGATQGAPAGSAQAAAADNGRAATATAVTKAWQSIPQFSVCRDIRAERLQETVATARAAGTPATVTDVLLVAFARALDSAGIDHDPSLGLAVATPNGVAIPVIPRPGAATLETVARQRAAAVERARGARATADDAIAVTATVSNLGAGGVRSFTGVVPLGQTLLLTVGSVRAMACVEDGRVVAGAIVTVTLNVDHRAYDGAHSAAILDALAAELETDTARIGKGDQVDA